MTGSSNDQRDELLGARLWLALSLTLGLPAALMGWVPLNQPDSTWPLWAQQLALHPDQGWRQAIGAWWGAAWLHGSAEHLYRNLVALSLIAAIGWHNRVPAQTTLVWFGAWPLTQIGMIGQPLHTYIGLSGVLHAGICAIALHQVTNQSTTRKPFIGYLLLLGLILKILMENPWQHALIKPPGSDINVAPWAHLSGTLSAAAICLFTSVTKRLPCVKRLTRGGRTLI